MSEYWAVRWQDPSNPARYEWRKCDKHPMHGEQDFDKPHTLTYLEAIQWLEYIKQNPYSERVLERLSVARHDLLWAAVQPYPGQLVNDHVCPSCRNERVSRQETNCWLCGGKL